MSGNTSTTAVLGFNRTVLETEEQDMKDAIHEFKIFNITITSLALCILAFTGVFCIVSYYSRRRQRKQARAYETSIGRDGTDNPVDVRGVQRTHSLRSPLSLLWRQDTPKDRSGIYFIYSNPASVTEDEGVTATPEETRTDLPPVHIHHAHVRDHAHGRDHAHSGIILDPSMFYMQL